jgi:HK97 family phage prohead protease
MCSSDLGLTQGESNKIRGVAALTGVETDLHYFLEVIEAGAFDETDMSDVRLLFNHDANAIISRTTAGTLRVWVEGGNLHYESEVPDTTAGRDLIENLRNGNITQSSFQFRILDADWSYVKRNGVDRELHTIKKVERLFDVAPVTFPAYPTTVAEYRALRGEEKKAIDGKETQQYRQRQLQIITKTI